VGGGIDAVFGGPPCQGFSLIGKRDVNDPRNGLIFQFLRLAEDLKLKYFVMENVAGLAVGEHRRFLLFRNMLTSRLPLFIDFVRLLG